MYYKKKKYGLIISYMLLAVRQMIGYITMVSCMTTHIRVIVLDIITYLGWDIHYIYIWVEPYLSYLYYIAEIYT